MNTSDMIYKIVALSVALIVVSMILIPMVTSATENEITITETGTNEADTTFGFDSTNITLAYDNSTWSFDSAHSEVVRVLTSSAYIILTGNSVTINGETVSPTVENSIIVSEGTVKTYLSGNGTPVRTFNLTPIASGNYVLTDAAETKTYGMWSSGAFINKGVNVIAIDSGAPVLETYDGTAATGSVTITATESEQYPTAYEVSAVGTSGMIVATLDFTYTDSVPMDDNLRTILGVVPYLVVIGVLLGATYLFISRRN